MIKKLEGKYIFLMWLKGNYPNIKKKNIFFICSTIEKQKNQELLHIILVHLQNRILK